MTEKSPADVSNTPRRPVAFVSSDVHLRAIGEDSFVMRCNEELKPYDRCVGTWLERWAEEAPQRSFLVEQTNTGERHLTFDRAYTAALRIAEGLLAHGLSEQRPLLIIAPAGIDHGLIVLAAHHIGVPFAPVAPAYALQGRDFAKLKRVVELLTPGLVIVADGAAYAAAIEATVPAGVPVVALSNSLTDRQFDLRALYGSGERAGEVALAAARVHHATIAKFLFTSGSTGIPKAVINTHGMLCAAAQMQRQVMAFLATEPPIMVDWLPWNHTAGGNSIFNITLHNGGTLYIDPGKPTREDIRATLGLLRRVSPTLYFNVPLGFEALLPYFTDEPGLRETFFRDLKCLWYAAAAMQPSTWDAIERLALDTIKERLLIVTGLGMTETSPAALFGNLRANGPGIVGVPIPGVELKLIRRDDQFEALFRGPNVTPGYWRDPVATAAAFDAEGYFISGDLLTFVDPAHPEAGLRFDGRASDDFKLTSGTRVSAGALRLAALQALAPFVTDAVVVGADRSDVRILMFPDWSCCMAEFAVSPESFLADSAHSESLRNVLRERLNGLAASATGNANRIVAAMIVLAAPSAAAGEMTEKGTINGRFLQRNRPELVDELFGAGDSPLIVRIS